MSTELLVVVLILALAVALIAGGLFLSRRAQRGRGAAVEERVAEAEQPRPEREGAPQAGAPTRLDGEPGLLGDVEVLEAITGTEAPVVVPAPAPPARPRLRDRLGKTRAAFSGVLVGLSGRGKVDPETWDELEEALILADVGVPTATRILEEVKERATQEKADAEGVLALLKAEILELLTPGERALALAPGEPNVWMFVGVNGVGKTTTIAKLARQEVNDGRAVVLAAADTFRAAAAEQLAHWAEAVGADLVRGQEGADPGSVVFDAMSAATNRGADLVLVDTAGRLHTKVNLMEELKKLRRIVDRTPGALKEVLLVVDASTGQNGLAQARQFSEAVEVTGVVLTKLDGTAKGGIVLAIQAELGIPVKVVGIGEGADDLVAFDPAEFVDALFA